MNLNKINSVIKDGEISHPVEDEKKIFLFTGSDGTDIYFEYKKPIKDMLRLLGENKNSKEVLANKTHFRILTPREITFLTGNSDNIATEDFSFADELNKNPDKINILFNSIQDFLDMVISGSSNAFVVSGMSQIGKTTYIMNYLEEKKNKIENIVLLKGASSPMALYDFLYANKDSIIVIDDCDSVFESEKALNILKAVLDPQEIRKVCWNSGEAAVPEFIFTGRIVFISNYSFFKMRKNKNFKHLIAVINRADYIEIDGTPEQVFEYIKKIESKLYQNKDIRKFIIEYLSEIIGKYSLRITPQLFKDLCRIKEYKASKFEVLSKIKLMALMLNN